MHKLSSVLITQVFLQYDINRILILSFSSFNPDPTIRNTFWTLTIGGAFTAMPPWTVSQAAVQRFLASDSVKTAQRLHTVIVYLYETYCSSLRVYCCPFCAC